MHKSIKRLSLIATLLYAPRVFSCDAAFVPSVRNPVSIFVLVQNHDVSKVLALQFSALFDVEDGFINGLRSHSFTTSDGQFYLADGLACLSGTSHYFVSPEFVLVRQHVEPADRFGPARRYKEYEAEIVGTPAREIFDHMHVTAEDINEDGVIYSRKYATSDWETFDCRINQVTLSATCDLEITSWRYE